MAIRKIVFAPGEIYHIYNKSLAGNPIFTFKKNLERALLTLYFYQRTSRPCSLSHFVKIGLKQKKLIEKYLLEAERQVDILSFCLMPNHFHLLLKEKEKNGISKFLSDFQNSYTRYYNIFHHGKGYLFQGQFKAKRIETDEQLIHVSRYIHLNPYTSYILKDFEQLKNYPWSSLGEYLNLFDYKICQKRTLLSHFSSLKEFEEFIFNQKDYQRELDIIQHLTLED